MTILDHSLKPAVAAAIAQLRTSFPGAEVRVEVDGNGGAVVEVAPLPLGAPYMQADSWIGFQIGFQYPYSDIYPHFVRPDLARLDGGALGEGLGAATFKDRPAVQISRRSNRWDPAKDTATLKLLKVHKWLMQH